MAKKNSRREAERDVAQNRKAFHEYEITDRFEAGMVLMGSEVKGLRERGASIRDAYAQVRGNEVYLVGLHIPEANAVRPQPTCGSSCYRREIEKTTRPSTEGARSSRSRASPTPAAPRSSWEPAQ